MRLAQAKAEWKAAHLVRTANGYSGHEGHIPPADCIEGTGALDPWWGWATCRTTVYGSHAAGAGLAIGSDGRRYMVLLIRTRQTAEIPLNSRNLIDTAHMTPSAPRVERCPNWPPRQALDHPIYVELTRQFYEVPSFVF